MFDITNLNVFAILVATILSFFLGSLWYGPLFSKPWMAALGLKMDDIHSSGISMPMALSASAYTAFARVFALALLFELTQSNNWQTGLLIAGIVWLAFSMDPMIQSIFWEMRPKILVAIDGSYEFTAIFLSAMILLMWT